MGVTSRHTRRILATYRERGAAALEDEMPFYVECKTSNEVQPDSIAHV